jgi:hypothetical protein
MAECQYPVKASWPPELAIAFGMVAPQGPARSASDQDEREAAASRGHFRHSPIIARTADRIYRAENLLAEEARPSPAIGEFV